MTSRRRSPSAVDWARTWLDLVTRPFRLMALAALTATSIAAADGAHATTHVVIVVMDGARYSETFGEPTRQYIPHLATELAPQGVLYTAFKNDGPTYTDAGHTAMVTGVYQEINNTGLEYPRNATIFQRYLAATKAPITDAWVITTKDKLQILTDCQDPEWQHTHVCSSNCGKGGKGIGSGYREDKETLAKVTEVLGMYHPHLMLVNFKQPDAAGHAKDWPGYLQGIRDSDAAIGAIWTFLQADPVYAGHTALFITDDHGRHVDGVKDGFVSHGDDCPGCRHIMMLTLGPDFGHGVVTAQHRGLIDICVTAASLLGITMPGSPGEVMTELMATSATPPAPAPAH
jgi:hypothetical protein